jgi:hypothetical protein
MICFLHIPKCGGSTVRQYIRTSLRSNSCQTDPRKTIFVYGNSGKIGDFNTDSDGLPGLASECPPAITKAIIGHFTYESLEKYLGHCNTYSCSFSICRHPLARLISNMNYIRTNPSHKAFNFFSSIDQDNLFSYCKSAGMNDASTFQLRFLTGLDHSDVINDVSHAINLAKSRVKIYKIENSMLALNTNVCYIPQSMNVKVVNATRKRLDGSSQPSTVPPFLEWEKLSNPEKEELEGIYCPDFTLWNSSL